MNATRNNNPGRYTAKFWESKVFRPVYSDRHGEKQECSSYYVRVKHAGRRRSVALNTSDRAEAGRKASKFYGRLRAINWEAALKELDPQSCMSKCASTVGDVISAVESSNLRKSTRFNYASALRWFAARHSGFSATKRTFGPDGSAAYRKAVHAVRLSDLTVEALNAVIEKYLNEAGRDANAQRTARISTASFLRNAKAGINAAAAQGMPLPEPKPFAGVQKPSGTRPSKYVSTFDAADLLRAAKKELGETPAAYIVVLLGLGAGLRRGEIHNLRWRCVDKERNRVLVLPTAEWSPKTQESEAAVDVDPSLIAEIEPFRTNPADFVTSPSALDTTVAWLRGKGVNGNMPLHTLRKEFGSLVCAESDLLTASRQLRHNNIATTASIYVEGRKRSAPNISSMLNPERPIK